MMGGMNFTLSLFEGLLWTKFMSWVFDKHIYIILSVWTFE